METLTKDPEVEIEPAERGEASAAKWQNPRVLLTVAALLAGLSIAVPAVMLVFVWPLNRASIDFVDGERVGGPWWPLVFGAMALSLGAGWKSIVLAKGSRVTTARSIAGGDGKHLPWLGGAACVVLLLAMPALILGPVLAFETYNGVGAGRNLVLLGLAGVAVAAVGVAASSPGDSRKWVPKAAIAAFVLAVLGNAAMLITFAILGIFA